MSRHHSDQDDLSGRPPLRTLLPFMTAAELDALAALLPMETVDVTVPPATGLIMLQHRDCFDTAFYAGEVLVSRAEVAYRHHRAQATVMGRAPELALMAAVLDVLAMDQRSDLLAEAAGICVPAEERYREHHRVEVRLIAATRVQFESMAEEK